MELRILHTLLDGPALAAMLARGHGIPADRMASAAARGRRARPAARRETGNVCDHDRGAALLGVPGLEQMILHHDVLYRDLADPVAFLRGGADTELARFWPYVFGAVPPTDPQTAATYSDLMAESQALVAEETLRQVALRGVTHLMDVGGGSGAFLPAVRDGCRIWRRRFSTCPRSFAAARERFSPRRC